MCVPAFDSLYVVSDLHMGGRGDFKIFRQGPLLAEFIRHIPQQGTEQVALVLNGDVVDFLAEEPFRYLDPEGAIDKLKRVVEEDTAFTVVWDALRDFVQNPGRHLVVVVGNHDVELALPHVRHWLTQWLSRGDEAARGRIVMAMDGAGWSCAVGDKQVLCLHGNEDPVNAVDFQALRQVARAVNSRMRPPAWDANAGTVLVIDIMNQIKKDYPFIDLLKPIGRAAVPFLVALDPSQCGKLHNIVSLMDVAAHGVRDWFRRKIGLLGAEEELRREGRLDEDALRRLLNDCYGEGRAVGEVQDVDTLLAAAYQRIKKGQDPKDQPGEMPLETLGRVGDYVTAKKKEALRCGLLWALRGDRSSGLTYHDQTFDLIDGLVSPQVDYVIAGHTHLARALERRSPGRYYYNCGTWICLMELQDDQLANQEVFETTVYDKLAARSFQTLEPLIRYQPHVVSITNKSGAVQGQLHLVQPDGSLQDVPHTQLP